MKASRVSFIVGVLQCIACASVSGGTPQSAQSGLLKKWALSRCLAKANAESPAGNDAAKAAAAYLERGSAGIEVYEKLDALAGRYLERVYTGSVQSDYNTMKCLDLYDSEELDRIAREAD